MSGGAGSKRAATKAVLDKNSVGSILEHTELIGELFQVTVPTVNEHLKGIYDDGELDPAATIRKFRIVRVEGSRQVARDDAEQHAQMEYERYEKHRRRDLESQGEDDAICQLTALAGKRKDRKKS